jgi:hypothetical protein
MAVRLKVTFKKSLADQRGNVPSLKTPLNAAKAVAFVTNQELKIKLIRNVSWQSQVAIESANISELETASATSSNYDYWH